MVRFYVLFRAQTTRVAQNSLIQSQTKRAEHLASHGGLNHEKLMYVNELFISKKAW